MTEFIAKVRLNVLKFTFVFLLFMWIFLMYSFAMKSLAN